VGGLQDDECPTSLFSRMSMDSGIMIPVIFVMASIWATNISYAPYLDNFDDILVSMLLKKEGCSMLRL
jgi:hypothetical protein